MAEASNSESIRQPLSEGLRSVAAAHSFGGADGAAPSETATKASAFFDLL